MFEQVIKYFHVQGANLLTQERRHRMLQRLFWNSIGARFVGWIGVYEQLFNVVVRNYSLIGHSNGERWLLTLLPDLPVVFDVGFHDGESTKEVLKVRPKAAVTGFDPSEFGKEMFQKRFGEDERARFVSAGVSDREGSMTFFDYANMCNSFAERKDVDAEPHAAYTVKVITLDDYAVENGIERIDFLKIDVEGFDLNVLEGAHRLLRSQSIELFMFEFASGWAGNKRYLWEVRDYFADKPYELFRLFNGFLCPFHYRKEIDSCMNMQAMYVGVSDKRLFKGDIPIRPYTF